MYHNHTNILVGAFTLLVALASHARAEKLTGQYLVTGNVSTIGKSMPSLNNRVTLSYVPVIIPGSFDYRLERYTEGSFHGVGDT